MRRIIVVGLMVFGLAACGTSWIGEDTLLMVDVQLADPVGDAEVITVENGTSLAEQFRIGQGFPDRVLFAPQSEMIVAAGATGIFVFAEGDLEQEPIFLSGHEGAITEIQIGPDDTIYSSGADGTIRSWDHETGTSDIIFQSESPVSDFALHPDGERIVFTHGAGIIWIGELDIVSGDSRRIEDINTRTAVKQMLLSEDGGAVIVIYGDMMIFDVETGEQLERSLVSTRDGVIRATDAQLITAQRNSFAVHSTRSWNELIKGSETRIFDDDSIRNIVMHPEGIHAIFFMFHDDSIKYTQVNAPFIADSWRVSDVVMRGAPVIQGDYNADGSRLVTSHVDGSLSLWNQGMNVLQTWMPQDTAILATAFSGDGSKVYRIDNHLAVTTFDAITGKCLSKQRDDPAYRMYW